MAAIRNLKKLTINRTNWIEGELTGPGDSNHCMMGFVGQVYGIERVNRQGGQALYGREFAEYGIPSWLMDAQDEIIGLNDSDYEPRREREKQLRAIFAKHGVELRFASKAEKPVEAVFEDDEPKEAAVAVKAPRALKLSDLEDSSAETPGPFKKPGKKAKVAHGG